MEDDQDILEKAERHYQEAKAKQKEAVAEIGQAEGLGETATVDFGGETVVVKSWLPGSISDQFADLMTAYENDNMAKLLRNMQSVAEVIATLCVEEPFNKEYFWDEYYQQWGPEGVITAFETISSPAMEGMESRMEVEDMEGKKNALGNSHKHKRDFQRQ
jgi:hypothetical protein